MDVLKAVTGGDSIAGRRLYQEVQNYRFFAKHFLAMNKFPEIADDSHGLKRRIYIIEFPRTFGKDEEDIFLEDKLIKELPGIFNWAMEGLDRLKKNKFQFTVSNEMLRKKDEYLADSKEVINFVKDAFPKGGGSSLKLKNLYNDFLSYDRESDEAKDIITKGDFVKIIKSNGFVVGKSSKNSNQFYVNQPV